MSAELILGYFLQILSVGIRADELVSEYNERKASGASDDEIKAWLKELLDKSINEAQTAIDKAP